MNGWLIGGAATLLLVLLGRLWWRWFSRRPLSATDSYAVRVDSDLDSVSGRPAREQPDTPTGDRAPRSTQLRSVPEPGPDPARPAPTSPTRPALPRQRTADDPRGDGPDVTSRPAAGAETAAARGHDRPAPLPPTG